MFIGVRQFFGELGIEVMSPKALGFTVNPIGMMEPGIEPLWRIWRSDLMTEHELHFISVGEGILFIGKVAVLFPPMHPTVSQSLKDLPGITFSSKCAVSLRNSCFAHVFGAEDVDGDLRPGFGSQDALGLFALSPLIQLAFDKALVGVGGLERFREVAWNMHGRLLCSNTVRMFREMDLVSAKGFAQALYVGGTVLQKETLLGERSPSNGCERSNAW